MYKGEVDDRANIIYAEYSAIEKDGQPGPFKPLSVEAFRKIISLANPSNDKKEDKEIIKECMLFSGKIRDRQVIIWWEKSHKREILIRNNQPKVYPVPAMLYALIDYNKFLVFALKSDKRPDRTTQLYRAPFDNTYDYMDITKSNVCLGNVKVKKDIVMSPNECVDNYNKAWWMSEFTSSTLLLDQALETGRFPNSKLQKTNFILNNLLE